jgi:CRISPR-associated protein Csh1
MGFLEGLIQTGTYYSQQDRAALGKNASLADLLNYLELPLDWPEEDTDPERRPRVIRVALQVTDAEAVPLDVQGIDSIHLADYPGPFHSITNAKAAYLYKDPVGSNVSWGFSPIYKLGRGTGDKAVSELLGKETPDWESDTKSRFYKMHKRTLADYEKSGFFTQGSTDRLMSELVSQVEEIAKLWQDRSRSYLIVFGVESPDGFRFPGQIPAFTAYFRSKLAERQAEAAPKTTADCMLCHKADAAGRTLNQVFKFSTFDKPGFLPGGGKANEFAVFPVCENCFSLLQRGYTEAEGHFSTQIGITGLELLVIPEMIGDTGNYDRLERKFQDFLQAGVESELGLFTNITRRDASYVFHFLFTERNQAQVRVHRMVEDVPPSHFRKLRDLWNLKLELFFPNRSAGQRTSVNLDSTIRQITAMLLSLAGKTDGEKEVMKERAVNLIADLFSNAQVDVTTLKRSAASRLPGLVSDPDWLNAANYSGPFKLERLWMLFEFLYAYNRHLDQVEVTQS